VDSFSQLLFKSVGLAVGALISGLVGVIVSRFQDKRRAIQSFQSTMFRLRSTFKRAHNAIDFHRESIPVLRDAVSAIVPHLTAKQRTRMEQVWQIYESISRDALDPAKESSFIEAVMKGMGWAYSTPSNTVQKCLDEIEATVTKRA
jgi:hypothetical protein